MMKNFTNKAALATAIALALGTTTVSATVFNATGTFRTIADVTVTEQLALTFGTAVTGKAGTTCSIAATIADGTTVAAETISGDGCVTSTEAAGEYVIGGAASTAVTILMASVDLGDYTFSPAGVFNDQDGTTDVITPYFSDSAITVTLDSANDGLLGVGGDLEIVNGLDASTSYSIAYDISVIY